MPEYIVRLEVGFIIFVLCKRSERARPEYIV